MRGRRIAGGLAPVVLLGTLLLSACGEEEERVAPYPVEMPQPPPGAQQPDDLPHLRTHLSVLTLGANQAGDTWASAPHAFDVTDSGPEEIIDYYDDQLTAEGWEPVAGLTELAGGPAASWERHDQGVTVFVITVDERDLVVVLEATDQWEQP